MNLRFLSFVLFAALSAGVAAESRAESFVTPALFGDTAATLPRGRWMTSFTTFAMDVSARYDGEGGREPISNLFTREIAWREVIEDDPSRSAQVEGLLASRAISADDSAGTYRGEFRGDVSGKVPVLGYGVTDRLGVFLAVPILEVRVRSKVVYESSENARRFVRELNEDGQTAVARDFEASLNQGFSNELRNAGYDYAESRDYSAVGDLRIEVPYLIAPPRYGRAVAVYGTVVLPTGTTADPREFYGISTGQNRYQAGVRGVATQAKRRWTFTQTAGTMVPFAGSRAVRVPRHATDMLSADIDPDARVSGGISYQLMADTRFAISRSWSLRGGLQHQRRFRDRYSGALFPEARYAYVNGAATERLESAFLNLEADSIASFLAGDFPIPGRVVVGVAEPLSGRNAIADRIAFVQANLFF